MSNLGKISVYLLSHVKVMSVPALTYLGISHFNTSLVPESCIVLSVYTLNKVGTLAAPKQWYPMRGIPLQKGFHECTPVIN
ncbi:hypothetical protein IV203_024031 [Nitzschia inconspicua]|uniref:Uncharacterized protein n=1 Tax=Nitzschia inconspicua TaxID=303405 RepID=A0A9K3KCJ6_9STRA|nr:hypothetical protein IV203_024031 [Nitzschia inconspicua]